jgi:uncharacterized protein YjdB
MNALRLCTIPCLLLLLTSSACSTSSRSSTSEPTVSRVGFTLEPSTRDLIAGETVTIFARSYDTYGRDPQIAWTTTAGKVTTEQNGRIARVKLDQPGSCVVTAVLTADGREIKRESVEIRVKPLSGSSVCKYCQRTYITEPSPSST